MVRRGDEGGIGGIREGVEGGREEEKNTRRRGSVEIPAAGVAGGPETPSLALLHRLTHKDPRPDGLQGGCWAISFVPALPSSSRCKWNGREGEHSERRRAG